MASSYRARVDDREFLNLPGFHGSAVVNAYLEDTSERKLQLLPVIDANGHLAESSDPAIRSVHQHLLLASRRACASLRRMALRGGRMGYGMSSVMPSDAATGASPE